MPGKRFSSPQAGWTGSEAARTDLLRPDRHRRRSACCRIRIVAAVGPTNRKRHFGLPCRRARPSGPGCRAWRRAPSGVACGAGQEVQFAAGGLDRRVRRVRGPLTPAGADLGVWERCRSRRLGIDLLLVARSSRRRGSRTRSACARARRGCARGSWSRAFASSRSRRSGPARLRWPRAAPRAFGPDPLAGAGSDRRQAFAGEARAGISAPDRRRQAAAGPSPRSGETSSFLASTVLRARSSRRRLRGSRGREHPPIPDEGDPLDAEAGAWRPGRPPSPDHWCCRRRHRRPPDIPRRCREARR